MGQHNEKFDAIVIGAGIAGLSSALTAVRLGMRVALVEKEDFIGGAAKDCFHTYICGLFKNDPETPFKLANPGLCSEVFEFLYNKYGEKCLVKIGKVETLAFIQKDLWDFFYNNLKNDKFTLYKKSKCTNAISIDGKIKKLNGVSLQNEINLFGDIFIDATGCSFLSESTTKQNGSIEKNAQLGGYCILLKGDPYNDLPLRVPYAAHKIVKQYNLDNYLKFVTATYNFLTKNYILKFSIKNNEDIEKCEFIYKKMNEHIPELSKLNFLKSSKTMHNRACNNINESNSCAEDQNPDTVFAAKSYWPQEKWDMNKGTQYIYSKKNKPFCISSSALKDQKYKNLFLAGKNIRVPENIHSSTRVMGVCIATGEKSMINASQFLKEN